MPTKKRSQFNRLQFGIRIFQKKFTQKGNNYKKVPILNNANFGYGRNNAIRLDENFFGPDLIQAHNQSIRQLTWEKCTVNGRFIVIAYFNEHTNIPLTREQYYDLKTAYTRAKKKFDKEDEDGTELSEFLLSFKKGSKKFRDVLKTEKKSYDIKKLTQVATFMRITGIFDQTTERLKRMYSMRNKFYLCNNVRVFLFKYYNNILGLGNRLDILYKMQKTDVFSASQQTR